ncbi:cysteine and histidine-rich domain-containing protein 1 [Petromyzon marinus]|uniref:Cysteine and histidine-rich domain-containing protein 1 n=1 Tax=Petromyzon marinus TaxID=7757 RepID=A0AAJ7UGF9_PETMA|nr:cysteine and histidine-rich domain-containing protein 1 [Petromyzon marinus]XP_032834347.1 cysteine and histidine-rich domain-containing protein 1 [Petromyzon marinus]
MSLLCYNRGCGQRFDADSNDDGCCIHHPGVPVFHDALKGWSCCKRRTTDFSDFLGIPGCTSGRHSNVKPPEAVKPEVRSDKEREAGDAGTERGGAEFTMVHTAPPKPIERVERPSPDEPMVELPITVATSLRQALEKVTIGAKETQKAEEVLDGMVQLGTLCKNSGCSKSYQGPESDREDCVYHTGGPVFHEGVKFWSCCRRKTSDFNTFLSQPGCHRATHVWVKAECRKAVPCRYDWHQTATQVVVTVYARHGNPHATHVLANRTHLIVRVEFEGDKEFNLDVDLFGVIDPAGSSVAMAASKVEVTLAKSSPRPRWASLAQHHPRTQRDHADDDADEGDEGDEGERY